MNIPIALLHQFDLSCFTRDLQGNAFIHIESSYDHPLCVPVAGKSQDLFDAWLTLRGWSKPTSQALFISLRGNLEGQRLSVKAIRAIINTTAKAKAQKTRWKEQFQVIQGGRQ